MSVVEIVMTLLAIFFAFGLGVVAILFTGGKTTLQYIQCKVKRTKKIFVWVDSFTGRNSVVGTIEGDLQKGVVSWKFNGANHLTEISQKSVKRWKDIYFMGVNLDSPLMAYDNTALGEMPVSKIDLKTFQNLLHRALTKPNLDDDQINKILIGLGLGLIIILAVIVIIFFKIDTLSQAIANLNVL